MSTAASTSSVAAAPKGGMLRNILHLSLGQAATTVLAILLSAAIARTLGASDFGLLYLVTTVGAFAYVFVDWGHLPYATREIARHPERAGDLVGTILLVRVLTAFATCIPFGITTLLLGYDWQTTIYALVLIISWLPGYMAMSYSSAFRGVERMDYDASIGVALKFATLIFSLIVLALGGRVLSLILLSILNGALTLALAAELYRRLHLPPLRISKATAYEVLRGGAPMLATGITIAIQPYLNANVLHKLAPAEVIGWYGATWSIGGTLVAPATILGTGMYPRFSKVAGDPIELKRVLRVAFRPLLLIGVLGAVGTYLFADVAINTVYSTRQYGPAADILRAFALGLLLIYVDMFLGSAMLARNQGGALAVAKTVAIVVTTAASFVLTGWFQTNYGNGGIGTMIAMAVGEIVMIVSMIVLLWHALDRGMIVDGIRALASGVLTIGIMKLLPALNPFITIPACIALFVGLSFVVGAMTRADLEMLLATVRRSSPADAAPLPTGGPSL
jgi:O-antigen/teichoic acid export membrane protein